MASRAMSDSKFQSFELLGCEDRKQPKKPGETPNLAASFALTHLMCGM